MTCVIRLRVSGLKKTRFLYLLDLFGGKEEKEWCDLVCVCVCVCVCACVCVCGVPLDDLANGVSVAVFLTHEYGCSFMVSWCYSREWVWNLRAELGCIASGK